MLKLFAMRPGIQEIGTILIVFGLITIGLGVLLSVSRRLHLGRLPGDITVKKGNTSFYLPIVTTLIVSLALTVLLNAILWLFRR